MWWKARPKAFLSQLFRLPSMCTLRLERQYLRCRYPHYSLRCTSSNRTSTPVIEIAFFRSLFFFESSLFVSDKESQAFYCSHCTACLHKHHLVKRIERIVYVSLFFLKLVLNFFFFLLFVAPLFTFFALLLCAFFQCALRISLAIVSCVPPVLISAS